MADEIEIEKRIGIVESMDEYVSFYDQPWAEQFSTSIRPTKLKTFGRDLILDWKAASYAVAMPWLLVHAIPDFVVAFSSFPQANPIAIPTRTAAEIWSEYMTIPGFPIVLWGSQRICYGAIYHAYENFLSACAGVASGKPNYRPRRNGKGDRRAPWQILKDDLNGIVAEIRLGDECLEDSNVFLARLIRNALAHKGGRTDQEIDSRNKCMQVVDGFVQVHPRDTRSLFNLLKDKVSRLAQVTREIRHCSKEGAGIAGGDPRASLERLPEAACIAKNGPAVFRVGHCGNRRSP